MIFQALVRKRRYLLTLITIILSVICSLPVFANSSLSIIKTQIPSLTTETFMADSSLAIVKQKQSFNLFKQLNLTEDQQRKIKQIHSQYRQQIRRKKNSIDKLQQQLSDMMVGTEPVELLRAKNQQLNNLRQEIGALRFESMLATREILTPQQREKFRDLVNSRQTDD
ncbi:MAG: Spy/CpxP family protein refolding chaperone [Cyanobacteria bacterium P01_G01_bin.67]